MIFIRILLCGLFDHLEQRRFLFYTVDDECSTEYFVATVFGVDLCETENFGVSQLASQIVFYLFSDSPFLLSRVRGLLSRCRLPRSSMDTIGSGWRLVVNTFWSSPFVHALQHRVVVGIFIFYRKIFLDAENVFKVPCFG